MVRDLAGIFYDELRMSNSPILANSRQNRRVGGRWTEEGDDRGSHGMCPNEHQGRRCLVGQKSIHPNVQKLFTRGITRNRLLSHFLKTHYKRCRSFEKGSVQARASGPFLAQTKKSVGGLVLLSLGRLCLVLLCCLLVCHPKTNRLPSIGHTLLGPSHSAPRICFWLNAKRLSPGICLGWENPMLNGFQN